MIVAGIVSNCFQHLLNSGWSLEQILEQARHAGFSRLELRHGALGNAATADGRFQPDVLHELANRFPELSLTPAVGLPCLTNPLPADAQRLWDSALNAAEALAVTGPRRLRVVDLDTMVRTTEELQRARSAIAARIADCRRRDIRLSLENARIGWSLFESLLTCDSPPGMSDQGIELCFDPCNQAVVEAAVELPELIRRASRYSWSMLHIKQAAGGRVLDRMGPGVLNWDVLWPHLRSVIQPRMIPVYWEIASSPEIWQRLSSAETFLRCVNSCEE